MPRAQQSVHRRRPTICTHLSMRFLTWSRISSSNTRRLCAYPHFRHTFISAFPETCPTAQRIIDSHRKGALEPALDDTEIAVDIATVAYGSPLASPDCMFPSPGLPGLQRRGEQGAGPAGRRSPRRHVGRQEEELPNGPHHGGGGRPPLPPFARVSCRLVQSQGSKGRRPGTRFGPLDRNGSKIAIPSEPTSALVRMYAADEINRGAVLAPRRGKSSNGA